MLARHLRLSDECSLEISEITADSAYSVTEGSSEYPVSPGVLGPDGSREPQFTPPISRVGNEQSGEYHTSGTSFQADLTGIPAEMNVIQALPWNEDDLDLLWNDSIQLSGTLPVNFFDTNISLTDVFQPRHIPYLGKQNIESISSTSTEQILPAPTLPFSPGTSHLTESNTTDESPFTATVDETDPSHNRQLKGNLRPSISPWKLSFSEYETFSKNIQELTHILPPSFALPSRHTLSRFLEGFFRGCHAHMPFLHTFSISVVSLGPELTLSLAAIGAFYRFENVKGYRIYHAARTLINWRLDCRNGQAVSNLAAAHSGIAGLANIHGRPPSSSARNENEDSRFDPSTGSPNIPLRLLQGLIVLMKLTSWGDRSVVGDSLPMSGQIAMLVRELGISVPDTSHETSSWEKWVEEEERRRTLWVAYIQFNLQSIAFDLPPMILNREVCLTLPSCGEEWNARNAQAWMHMRSLHTPDSRNFQQALRQLLDGHQIHKPNAISAFANYVLIHGLFQEIFFARNTTSLVDHTGSLQLGFIQAMESALQAWQSSWEATYESTLDPLSPRGPMGFNATALVRLAYIRLNANIGPRRHLNTWNPAEIAHELVDGKGTVHQRSPSLDRAILQCVHALSIPVYSGIHFVARTQTLNWSIQHSLCNIECAFLLNHWLHEIARCIELSGVEGIREDERKLLGLIYSIVREADIADLSDWRFDNANAVRHLAACTARLWAEAFKGFHIFNVSQIIGESLAIFADILES
jgi:hypothetical protein